MFYGFDFHCSFPELIKIKRSNPLVCYQQPVPHQLNHVRAVILHTQSRLTLVLEIPETDLLLASKNELLVVDLHDFVALNFLAFFLFHHKVELLIVDYDGILLLHDDVVAQRVNKGD